MTRQDNYQTQVRQAQQYFLGYDQQKLIGKLKLRHDGDYLYGVMLAKNYRLSRRNGTLQRQEGGSWVDASGHGEVMTLLDLICDSRENRYVSGRWKQMEAFGLMFHRNLLEHSRDPFAEVFQENPAALERACIALGGEKMGQGDVSYAVELFDGLRIWVQFWEGDEEFPPQVRYLWDENALMYLKYETMWFALGVLRQRILEEM